jgi:hypothetical protein
VQQRNSASFCECREIDGSTVPADKCLQSRLFRPYEAPPTGSTNLNRTSAYPFNDFQQLQPYRAKASPTGSFEGSPSGIRVALLPMQVDARYLPRHQTPK